MNSGGCHLERKKPLSDYIIQKLSMLEDEFYINLSHAEVSHMRALKSEGDVDLYAHQLLMNKL